MQATFFTKTADDSCNHIEEIPEETILGGGQFTKDNISELLSCFKSGSSAQTDNLWLLSISFSETLSTIDDESLKEIAGHWSDESSWLNTDVNTTDLAGHLLELKYAYTNSDERIWILFD
ncbi:hypothetical protein [Colwellia psychrerythraea]|uniref:Uncharacterized protein n=1 Tax=Colwellia psychrerythraea TaxID=28229 RepID=A0A099L3C4_COLPS|nr:hypothetical protein [Colwellia psychrerythraea]KGJ97366.1 hypothetical protein GAB14E_0955 [Colwellia psychrerythraea]